MGAKIFCVLADVNGYTIDFKLPNPNPPCIQWGRSVTLEKKWRWSFWEGPCPQTNSCDRVQSKHGRSGHVRPNAGNEFGPPQNQKIETWEFSSIVWTLQRQTASSSIKNCASASSRSTRPCRPWPQGACRAAFRGSFGCQAWAHKSRTLSCSYEHCRDE